MPFIYRGKECSSTTGYVPLIYRGKECSSTTGYVPFIYRGKECSSNTGYVPFEYTEVKSAAQLQAMCPLKSAYTGYV